MIVGSNFVGVSQFLEIRLDGNLCLPLVFSQSFLLLIRKKLIQPTTNIILDIFISCSFVCFFGNIKWGFPGRFFHLIYFFLFRAFQCLDELGIFTLSPKKIDLIIRVHNIPPKTILKTIFNQNTVITFSNKSFISSRWGCRPLGFVQETNKFAKIPISVGHFLFSHWLCGLGYAQNTPFFFHGIAWNNFLALFLCPSRPRYFLRCFFL